MKVSRKRFPSCIDLYFGDCQLAVHDKLDILGVIIYDRLLRSKFKHISSVASRAGQKLGALRKLPISYSSEAEQCYPKHSFTA